MLSFHSRTGCPLPVSPAASPLTLPRPTLSKQCFRFTLHLSSRVVPVTCFVRYVYHVLPYRNPCKKLVHELLLQNFAIGSRYLNSYTCTIQLFGREAGGPCNLYRSKRTRPFKHKLALDIRRNASVIGFCV